MNHAADNISDINEKQILKCERLEQEIIFILKNSWLIFSWLTGFIWLVLHYIPLNIPFYIRLIKPSISYNHENIKSKAESIYFLWANQSTSYSVLVRLINKLHGRLSFCLFWFVACLHTEWFWFFDVSLTLCEIWRRICSIFVTWQQQGPHCQHSGQLHTLLLKRGHLSAAHLMVPVPNPVASTPEPVL